MKKRKSILETRTPLFNSFLRILIYLAVSMLIIIYLIELHQQIILPNNDDTLLKIAFCSFILFDIAFWLLFLKNIIKVGWEWYIYYYDKNNKNQNETQNIDSKNNEEKTKNIDNKNEIKSTTITKNNEKKEKKTFAIVVYTFFIVIGLGAALTSIILGSFNLEEEYSNVWNIFEVSLMPIIYMLLSISVAKLIIIIRNSIKYPTDE
ncbi:MAG: hypothetical protein HPPSJP_5040 [Candidatus Hepatoplasma scabrum]|nr:MAG: hypothetical protein HPPSJP_5040 [Candidatus Hepatoplasma sp.]